MKCKILVADRESRLENAINEFIKDKENVSISLSYGHDFMACILYDRCYADSMI